MCTRTSTHIQHQSQIGLIIVLQTHWALPCYPLVLQVPFTMNSNLDQLPSSWDFRTQKILLPFLLHLSLLCAAVVRGVYETSGLSVIELVFHYSISIHSCFLIGLTLVHTRRSVMFVDGLQKLSFPIYSSRPPFFSNALSFSFLSLPQTEYLSSSSIHSELEASIPSFWANLRKAWQDHFRETSFSLWYAPQPGTPLCTWVPALSTGQDNLEV